MKIFNLKTLGAGFIAAICTGCAYVNEPQVKEIAISSPGGSAVIALEGGRIISWKNAAGEELFFMPANPCSPDGDWSHGGTSICWPWFGRTGKEESSIHGFARRCRFSLLRRTKTADGESVTLGIKTSQMKNILFPNSTKLELTVAITDRLGIKLKTTNLDCCDVELTQGIQSYFPVSDYSNIVFHGIGKTDFAAVHGMDKAFRRTGDVFGFSDSRTGRRFTMKASGNNGIVVWTPGTVEPANRNLAHDDCPRFIVVGPSQRKNEGAAILKPGETSELAFTIAEEN